MYATIAGPDAKDPATIGQPPLTLEGIDNVELSGLRLGVYPPWFKHASMPMVQECRKLLKGLESIGAQVALFA